MPFKKGCFHCQLGLQNATEQWMHRGLGLGHQAKKPFPFTKPDILVPATDVKDSKKTKTSLNMWGHQGIYGNAFKILGVIVDR